MIADADCRHCRPLVCYRARQHRVARTALRYSRLCQEVEASRLPESTATNVGFSSQDQGEICTDLHYSPLLIQNHVANARQLELPVTPQIHYSIQPTSSTC
jgi:hypothetical protein